MKILLLVLSAAICTMAQNYFPSYLGSKFQNSYSYYNTETGYSLNTWYSYEIEKDSMLNGKRFVKIKQNSNGPFVHNYLYHFDETEQKLLMKVPNIDSPRVAVDFNVAAGDSFISYFYDNTPKYFKSHGVTYFPGLGVNGFKISGYFLFTVTRYRAEYLFVEDLGLFKSYVWIQENYTQTYEQATDYVLRSAIIDTLLYKPVTLNITTISPLENRPVNSFPFIINGNFVSSLVDPTSNLVPLIDSFYIKMVQLRGNDTIGTFHYPFNSSKQAFVSLMPEEGDRLLVQAVISDTSIFNNYDIFPDSGHAEILVLPYVPVELTSFTAEASNNEVLLQWTTASELNNSGFEIERKILKDQWITIAFISGHGTSMDINNYSYIDNVALIDTISTIHYRLRQVDYNGSFEYSDEVEVFIAPQFFNLNQNYPNPFNSATTIQYQIPSSVMVRLIVYDVLGNEIAALVNEEKQPGIYTTEFNGAGLSSGIYFYRLTAGDRSDIKKMIMMK